MVIVEGELIFAFVATTGETPYAPSTVKYDNPPIPKIAYIPLKPLSG
jgi:hypothetical protein